MNHKLLLSEKDRWEYFWSYFNIDKSEVWRKEDLPKLQPFFNYSSTVQNNDSWRKMNEEECISFDYYKKLKMTTSSSDAPLGYKNASIQIQAPSMYVNVEAKMSTSLYFIAINLALSAVQQSAS